MKDFRSDLSDELTALTPPPLGDVVAEATRKGRRARRARTLGQVTGSALALAAVAVLVGGQLHGAGGGNGLVGPAAGGAPALAASASSTPSPAASGALVRVSGAAVLATTLDALPVVLETSGYAATDATAANGKYPADVPAAKVNFRTPQGLGTVRIFVGTASPDATCSTDDGCHRDKYGQQVRVTHSEDNCVQNAVITVLHADSTAVTVQLANCPAGGGKPYQPGLTPGNPVPPLTTDPEVPGLTPGHILLTDEDAAELAGNPAFHTMMTPAQGAAAAARFPALPQFD